jgi:hypothetical protein
MKQVPDAYDNDPSAPFNQEDSEKEEDAFDDVIDDQCAVDEFMS